MKVMQLLALAITLFSPLLTPERGQGQETKTISEGGSVTAPVVNGWHLRRQENYRPNSYGAQIVPAPGRMEEKALRLELRRGDCGKFADGWNDCTYVNERIEMVTSSEDFIPVNTRGEYGWSIYLEPDWNADDLSEIVMGQFHQEGQFNPAFQFFYQSHGGGLQVKSRVDTKNGTFGKEVRTIIPEKELRGRWHDIRVQAYWRNKADGYFKVFVDGTLAYDFEGKTTSAKKVFYKLGIYRLSAQLKSPTLVVYYAHVWRK